MKKCIGGQGNPCMGAMTKLRSIVPFIGALLLLLAFSPQSSGAQSIKVASFNVRVETTNDGFNNWPYRKQNVVTHLKTTHAVDIFGLQEDSQSHVDYIKSNMPGYDFVGRGANSSPTSGEYCAIFYRTSRFQVLEPAQTRWLSTTPTVAGSISWGAWYPRILTQVKLRDLQTNIDFWVFNTHFEHDESGHDGTTARNNSALLLKQWVNDVGNYPVIVTGDFNAPMGTTAMTTIVNTPLTNTLSITETTHTGAAATIGMNPDWTTISGSYVIDHVFVKSGTRALDHRHPTDKYDRVNDGATTLHFPSDHLAVVTTLVLPPPAGGGTTSVTLKNGSNGYSGASSFHVSGQSPTSHSGASNYYHVTNSLAGTNGFVYRAFYKFDVSQSASGIPAGATITSARLKIKVEPSSSTTGYGVNVYRMNQVGGANINYATATRNTYDGTNSWTGGNTAGDNDIVTTPVATAATIPAAGGWFDFDVTSAVQAWVNGTPNNGLMIRPNSGANTISLRLSTVSDLHGSAEYVTLDVTYASAPPSTTKVLKNGSNGYSGATSFHVSGQSPTGHSGPSNYYHVTNSLVGTNGYVYRTFYKFDVSPTASGIPSGAIIDSARLKVKVEPSSSTTGYGVNVYRVAPATSFTVNYATATRNTYNGTNSWTGGGNAGDNDIVTTPVTTAATIPAAGSWFDFDVTSAVQAWVNGTPNNGLIIRPNSGANTVTLRLSTASDLHGSSEYVTLEVTYH